MGCCSSRADPAKPEPGSVAFAPPPSTVDPAKPEPGSATTTYFPVEVDGTPSKDSKPTAEAQPVRPPRYAVPAGPLCYLTSTGFVTDSQWARFIQVVLKKKGVLQDKDAGRDASRAELVAKYASDIAKLKVTYINDASYHRPPESMARGRGKLEDGSYSTAKVGEGGHLGRGEGSWLWWDQALEDKMCVPVQNITMVQLLEKPWLFNQPGREANCAPSRPDVTALEPSSSCCTCSDANGRLSEAARRETTDVGVRCDKFRG